MTVGVVTALAAAIVAWSLVAGRVERDDLSGPIVFVVLGLGLANGPLSLFQVSADTASVHLAVEVTLVLLLFGDASQVVPRDLQHDAQLPARLLAVGLPLTLAAGFGLAAVLFSDLPWELAALLGAVLAPTDAALSAAVMSDRSLPVRIRRALNVESGLNDGIATPVVTTLIAAAVAVVGAGTFEDTAMGIGLSALVDLVGGVAVGVATGYGGGRLIRHARTRGWMEPGGRRVAVLGLVVLAFSISRELDVNYFVAAFVAGLAFRAATGPETEEATELPEVLGGVMALAVWFVFGAAMLLPGLEHVDWRVAVYAVASLTVVRMVPVALSLLGSRTPPAETLFLGWFGPRGLASVVFGLLILEELPASDPGVRTVLATIVLTVVLSVVAHGVSAHPLAARLVRAEGGRDPAPKG